MVRVEPGVWYNENAPITMPHLCGKSHPVRLRRPNLEEPPQVTPRDEIARLAYSYWLERGCQGGSPEEDWYRAEREWDERVARG